MRSEKGELGESSFPDHRSLESAMLAERLELREVR